MKKIKATVTTTNELIAEITISDEDKKSSGLSAGLLQRSTWKRISQGLTIGNGKRILFGMVSQTLLVIGS